MFQGNLAHNYEQLPSERIKRRNIKVLSNRFSTKKEGPEHHGKD